MPREQEAWPKTLIRRGAKVPDDGSRWWQELPRDASADGVRSLGYEVVDVLPVSASHPLVEALEDEIHTLASTIGRARVIVDDRSEAATELRCAADAIGRLRKQLSDFKALSQEGE